MSNESHINLPPKLPPSGAVPPRQDLPPKLPKRKNTLARIVFAAVMGLVVVAVMIIGLFVLSQVTRRDKPEDYALLATMLYEPITLEGGVQIQLSDAEKELKVGDLPPTIQRIARRDKNLSPVANDIMQMIQSAGEIAKNAPQGSKIVFGLAEALLGGYTGQRELVGSGGKKALDETERGWAAVQGVMGLFDKKHVAAIKLAELAPQFSGPLTNTAGVTCVFAQHDPGFLDFSLMKQVLTLKNNSGSDLENCTICVRLSNAKGESYVNVHFAPRWPAGRTLTARYSDTGFPKNTIDGVTRVDINAYTDKCSFGPVTITKPTNGWPDIKTQ